MQAVRARVHGAAPAGTASTKDQSMSITSVMAIILLVVLLLPGLVLGFTVAPWFFLLLVLAGVVPLFFIARSPTDT